MLEPRFHDCGFLKVNIHKSKLIRNSASIFGQNTKMRFTLFHLHKLLLGIGLFIVIVLDIKKYEQIAAQWDAPAVSSGFTTTASSE